MHNCSKIIKNDLKKLFVELFLLTVCCSLINFASEKVACLHVRMVKKIFCVAPDSELSSYPVFLPDNWIIRFRITG